MAGRLSERSGGHRPRPHLAVRVAHLRLVHLRGRPAGVLGLVAVMGPGLLAGLSDDDPAGITTYSILGTDYGYRLLWVLAVSTVALIVFHEVAARTGVVTGKGLMRLVRERYGGRAATFAVVALVVANVGTICAEFAGIAAGMEVLTGMTRYLSVPVAAMVVSMLVLRASSDGSSTSSSAWARSSWPTWSPGCSAIPTGRRRRRDSWSRRCC